MRLVVFNDATEPSQRLLDLLRLQPGIDIAGITSDEYEALRLIEAARPDTILFDIASPGHWRLAILEAMRRCDHRGRVIVLRQQSEAADQGLARWLGANQVHVCHRQIEAWLEDMSRDTAACGAVLPFLSPQRASSRPSPRTARADAVFPSIGHGLPPESST